MSGLFVFSNKNQKGENEMYSKTYRGAEKVIPAMKDNSRCIAKVAMKKAYDKVRVGGKYFLPLTSFMKREDDEDLHRLCTCVAKHDHFAVFRTPKGYNVTFLWIELGRLLDERLCS